MHYKILSVKHGNNNHRIYFQYIRYNWAEMLKKRKGNQRRLIHALPVNLELDLFEARIATLYDVVDIFLIGGKYVLNIIYHPITNDFIIRSGRLLKYLTYLNYLLTYADFIDFQIKTRRNVRVQTL